MDIQQAYDIWAEQYDSNVNKTRDLEAVALKTVLSKYAFDTCLEMGCGTGKNTVWLSTVTKKITAVDISKEMLTIAKEKIDAANVQFIQSDILEKWTFGHEYYDLIVFSLVLEHINNLNIIFQKAFDSLTPGGLMYVGELHPFKQYTGTKARFVTQFGQQKVTCFNHHISDFTASAIANGFDIANVWEVFDDIDRTSIPRILSLLFIKKSN